MRLQARLKGHYRVRTPLRSFTVRELHSTKNAQGKGLGEAPLGSEIEPNLINLCSAKGT